MTDNGRLPWRVRPGTLIIEDALGRVVTKVRSGQWYRKKVPVAGDMVSREQSEKNAQRIVDAVNKMGNEEV